jgi:iron-sulfur cluster assembly accessory protein
MAVSLTQRAKDELKEIMTDQEKPNAALRIWVSGGGCSGLSYGMALDDSEPEEGDQVFEEDGIKLFVDSMSLNYMSGSVVDFVDDGTEGAFKIDNPNAVSGCGCGSSFKTADSEAPSGGGCQGCPSSH